MNKLVILCVLALAVVVAAKGKHSLKLNRPANDYNLINQINSMPGVHWKAGHQDRFHGKTLAHVKSLCGTLLDGGMKLPMKKFEPLNITLPESFDPREKPEWSNCPSLKEVRDQSTCGSCWAFGAAEAMTDRTCIHSGGKVAPHLSATDVLSCCGFWCGQGCNGGYPSSAWSYWVSTGLVTGGNADSSDTGCFPYPFAPCSHHVPGAVDPCGESQPTPTCANKCVNGATWSADKHFGATNYQVGSSEQEIMQELYTNGPAEAAFTVYEDFTAYTSGVYHHVTGSALGGHAVKIMGWGVENGVKYWIIMNSWNSSWGEGGQFKILRGSDECGIESQIVAGMPK